MDETFIYQRIAEDIRQEILSGRLKAGERLQAIRLLTQKWNCTPGTIQKAYQELAHQGLVISQAGKGTHVTGQVQPQQIQTQLSLRSAKMVHQAEAFLLESLSAGYNLDEIQQAIDMAKDRWRSIQQTSTAPININEIRFSGSHDLLIIWMAGHMAEIVSGAALQLNFTGSLGGLMALAENQADIAGCHLWDPESNTYNLPYISKLFPGQQMTVVRLATRRIGFITAPGNPKNIHQIENLVNPGVRFVNRQTGSGTRVWLDTIIHQKKIDSSRIIGFENEKMTHSDVARTIAEGNADSGIGLELAAVAFNLSFLPLAEEPYDLVTYASRALQEPLLTLFNWIRSDDIKQLSSMLPGYDFQNSGEQINLME